MDIVNKEHEDFHIHSFTFSDGLNTIDEIVKFAGHIGLKKIAITDHCQAYLDGRGYIKKSGYGIVKRWQNVFKDVEVIFGIAASIVVAWFSRQREFRADLGGAQLAGRGKMVAALERLRSNMEPSHLPDQMAAFGIRSGGGGLAALFSSHPPLEERIAALRSV